MRSVKPQVGKRASIQGHCSSEVVRAAIKSAISTKPRQTRSLELNAPDLHDCSPNPAIGLQYTARGSVAASSAPDIAIPCALDESQIASLLQFFEALDRLDRKAHPITQCMPMITNRAA